MLAGFLKERLEGIHHSVVLDDLGTIAVERVIEVSCSLLVAPADTLLSELYQKIKGLGA